MTSAAQRQLDADVARTIFAMGGKIKERGVDGAGHLVVTIEKNGWLKDYHYAHTVQGCGRARLNTLARLKRVLKDIPPPMIVETPAPVITPKAADPMTETRFIVAPPTPPNPKRLVGQRRKDAIKRYLSCDSIADWRAEFDLTEAKAVAMLLSSRGQAAEKCKAELQRRRMEEARKRRQPKMVDSAKSTESGSNVLQFKTRAERDALVRKLYLTTSTTLKEIGRRVGISASNAWRIAHK